MTNESNGIIDNRHVMPNLDTPNRVSRELIFRCYGHICRQNWIQRIDRNIQQPTKVDDMQN